MLSGDQLGFVVISDWTLNSAVIMTNFERGKHFMKYTISNNRDAAYYFDPPTACVKQNIPHVPAYNVMVPMAVCTSQPRSPLRLSQISSAPESAA